VVMTPAQSFGFNRVPSVFDVEANVPNRRLQAITLPSSSTDDRPNILRQRSFRSIQLSDINNPPQTHRVLSNQATTEHNHSLQRLASSLKYEREVRGSTSPSIPQPAPHISPPPNLSAPTVPRLRSQSWDQQTMENVRL